MEHRLQELVSAALRIWRAGGWGMVPLAINGLVMYGLGLFMLAKLMQKGLHRSPERVWRRWETDPGRVRDSLARLLGTAMQCRTLEELQHHFEAVRNDELVPFERDLNVMNVSVSAAPLLGLLGTVTGMLATFSALATGGGGDQTMGMVAGGISEALITTETGLVLALAGVMFQFVLKRQHDKYGKVVAHLETLCAQRFQQEGRT